MATDIHPADIALIEAEVEFRLKAKLEQLQAEAAEQRVRDLARIEREAATRLEPVVAEAHAAGEAAALEALAGEVEHVRRQADEQRATEVARELERFEHPRSEADASREASIEEALKAAEVAAVRARYLEAELAQVKDDAEVVRDSAIDEALKAAEVAAARARDLEAELARVKADTDARVESEARLTAETYRSLEPVRK